MTSESQAALLAEAEAFARDELSRDSSGHDWWHIQRVVALARHIAREEGADGFICELAALLHDVADEKIAGSEEVGLAKVRGWLEAHGADGPTIEHVMEIIATMSFGGGNRPPMRTLEGRVVQDADRLDAIGAVGIGRAFAFGGSRGRAMYDPTETPQAYASKEAYHASTQSTISHFREKLLLLKDRMNTPAARRLAEQRHRYMDAFLEEFAAEWNGER
ncbi:MAG TPA: HD domain-containing protein [Ktedonobacterales bacterium]|nr:HD domain-containing protein [Ktedonobacterales bacterium]